MKSYKDKAATTLSSTDTTSTNACKSNLPSKLIRPKEIPRFIFIELNNTKHNHRSLRSYATSDKMSRNGDGLPQTPAAAERSNDSISTVTGKVGDNNKKRKREDSPTKVSATSTIQVIGNESGMTPANQGIEACLLKRILITMERSESRISKIELTMNQVKSRMNRMGSKLDYLLDVNHPHQDDFYDKLHVQKNCLDQQLPTWSLMKISNEEKFKCVAVTSAHLIGAYQHVKGETNFFIPIPESYGKAGVECAYLHERIIDEKEITKVSAVDIMVIVLKDIPEDTAKKWKDLHQYPNETYNKSNDEKSWYKKDIVGQTSQNFVTGRGLIRKKPKNGGHYYEFFVNEAEKGDSGALMFAISSPTTDGSLLPKEFIGTFKGAFPRRNDVRTRGLITPAIGLNELIRLEVDSEMGKNKEIKMKHKEILPKEGHDKIRPKERPKEKCRKEREYIYKVTSNEKDFVTLVSESPGSVLLCGIIVKVDENMNSKFTSLSAYSADTGYISDDDMFVEE